MFFALFGDTVLLMFLYIIFPLRSAFSLLQGSFKPYFT